MPPVACLIMIFVAWMAELLAGEERFAVVSSNDGGGLGNYLVFFPTVFYFAAFSQRAIVIMDHTPLAGLCQHLQCAFPLLSEARYTSKSLGELRHEVLCAPPSCEMAPARDSVVSTATAPLPRPLIGSVAHTRLQHSTADRESKFSKYRAADLQQFLLGQRRIDEPVVLIDGFRRLSQWFAPSDPAAHCIELLSHCGRMEVTCREHFALRKLVPGPLRGDLLTRLPALASTLAAHLVGYSPAEVANLMPGASAAPPAVDIGLHLRCQFRHFEQGAADTGQPLAQQREETLRRFLGPELFALAADGDVPLVAVNVSSRLCARLLTDESPASLASEGEAVFAALLRQLRGQLNAAAGPLRLFVTSDELGVKHALLQAARKCLASDVPRLQLAYVRFPAGVVVTHTRLRHRQRVAEDTGTLPALLEMLDWFLLAQVRAQLWTWRRQHTLASTFAVAAFVYGSTPSATRAAGGLVGRRLLVTRDLRRNADEAAFESRWLPIH